MCDFIGKTLTTADMPAVPLTCLLFMIESTSRSMSKLNVDSLEYMCWTEACSFSNDGLTAKKRGWSGDLMLFAVM